MPSISKKLRLARKNAGLTQQDIANRTHLSIEQIQMIESGKFEKIEGRFYQKAMVMKIAKALSLNVHEISHKFDEVTKDHLTPVDLELQRLKNKTKSKEIEEAIVVKEPEKVEVKSNSSNHKVINQVNQKKRIDLITIILSLVATMIIVLLMYTIYTLLSNNYQTASKNKVEPKTELISQQKNNSQDKAQIKVDKEEQAKKQFAEAKEKLGLEYKGEEDNQLAYSMPYKDEYKVTVKALEFSEILDVRDDSGQLYYSDSIDKSQQQEMIIDNETSYILIYAKPANNLEITINGVTLPVVVDKLTTEYRVYRIDILQGEE